MPGTTVKFDPGVHLFVDGRLTADGTSPKGTRSTENNTASPFPWGGIQFNASSFGSVSWSTFDRVDRAVTATDSSPGLTSNTILQAGVGFAFVRSSSWVSSNTILRATNVGVYANTSDVQIAYNSINGTAVGIQIEQPSFPTVSGNTITSVSSGFAMGILVTAGASASIDGNTIRGVRGSNGAPGGVPGAPGRDGAIGAGIYVSGSPSASITSNTVDIISGGRGGDGQPNTGGAGGRGGNGGPAAGIVVVATPDATIQWNMITSVTGGSGGAGGGSATTIAGGRGGDAGTAVAIAVFYVSGSATVHANAFTTLVGGDGGRGVRGGYGGNSTGVIFFGNNDGSFNSSQASFNQLDTLTGGAGGIGTRFGGNGGATAGIAGVFVSPSFSSNWVTTLQGGRGGDALDLTDGGRGGDALGIISGLVMNGLSLEDTVSGVTKGGAGGGAPIQTSYADGYYLIGNKTFTTRFTVDNATLSSIGSYQFYVDNYTEAIAVNTPFTKLAVMAAGNLTVRNYLEVDALWPNGFTPVGGAHITVMDGSSRIWDRQAPSGGRPWILVTDRIYIDSPIPTDNVTQVSVTYPPYSFASDPRSVNMGTSHTESFVMVDKDAPTSAAGALPTYENVLTFWVGYTASDGNGTGVGNITLWYRTGGGGGSGHYTLLPARSFGHITVTASSNGVYEFATTADDVAGNKEVRPAANDTWTTVDTIRPGSHVNGLSQYQNRSTFTVSWGPDAGVTDVVSYTMQYNTGAAWTNWLVDNTATTGA